MRVLLTIIFLFIGAHAFKIGDGAQIANNQTKPSNNTIVVHPQSPQNINAAGGLYNPYQRENVNGNQGTNQQSGVLIGGMRPETLPNNAENGRRNRMNIGKASFGGQQGALQGRTMNRGQQGGQRPVGAQQGGQQRGQGGQQQVVQQQFGQQGGQEGQNPPPIGQGALFNGQMNH